MPASRLEGCAAGGAQAGKNNRAVCVGRSPTDWSPAGRSVGVCVRRGECEAPRTSGETTAWVTAAGLSTKTRIREQKPTGGGGEPPSLTFKVETAFCNQTENAHGRLYEPV